MRFKNLERYRTGGAGSRLELAIPIPRTPDGRAYRFSPNENAHPRHFVIGEAIRPDDISDEKRARMKLQPGTAQTVCPYSGTIADDDEFVHPEDQEAALEIVRHAALADVREQLGGMFRDLERGQSRNSMIRFEVQSSGRRPPRPRFNRADLLRELMCDHCGRDYGVYAIALFCPDCGAPNLRLHFGREVELVDAQVQLAEGLDEDHEELGYRLLGNAHEDVLTAFEATLKAAYFFGRAAAKPGEEIPWVGNDFQNVGRGGKRFAELGCDPYSVLENEELAAMKLNIQKRHVIGHNLGVVDARFAEESSEAGIGETLELVGADIIAFACTAQKVVNALDAWIGGVALPPCEREVMETPDQPPSNAATAKLGLSEPAFRVGTWLTEHSKNGLLDPVNGEAMLPQFEGTTLQDLEDAIAELEVDGYITARSFGGQLPYIVYGIELFSTFDPLIRGTDPTADAAALGRIALTLGESIGTSDLHGHTDWDLRRFNPALNILVSHVDSQHVSRSGDEEYQTHFFHLAATDRVAIKRFVERHAPV